MRKSLFLVGVTALFACSKPKTLEEEVALAVPILNWIAKGQEWEDGTRVESIRADGRAIVFSFVNLPNDTWADAAALTESYREFVCQRDSSRRMFAEGITMRFDSKLADQTPLPTVTIDHC